MVDRLTQTRVPKGNIRRSEEFDPEFRALLSEARQAELRRFSGAVYGVWPDFTLAYLNPGWFEFAATNNGGPMFSERWGLGSSILEGMSPAIRDFYQINLSACFKSGRPWSHEYECPSDKSHRMFRQTAHALGQQAGLLIVNALVVERPHDDELRPPHEGNSESYVNADGFISVCSHCRLVKNLSEPERWDWVPEWVRSTPKAASHTFCPVCLLVYYPELAE